MDANIKDKKGYTALHMVAESGEYRKVKALLKYGADTGITNNDGNTAIKLAVKNNHDDIFDLLVKNNCKY